MRNIILASGSPRRKELLTQIGIPFEIVKAEGEEVITTTVPEEAVKELSRQKAREVDTRTDGDVVIGADTVVAADHQILGKPKDKNHAFEMLKLLSNNVHRVYSGVAVINNQKNIMKSECLYTEVYFSEISDDEIWRYIESGECLDKAGAYGIQGYGGVFAEKINGCYYNVVGLPLNLLNKMIKNVL